MYVVSLQCSQMIVASISQSKRLSCSIQIGHFLCS
nr:MAG TPA: hypothetical protein [Caudoviricetes sp.]